MQIAYRAKSLAEAHGARDVLTRAGIATHVADELLWAGAGVLQGANVIRVLVDNHQVDHARRALRSWVHRSRD